MTAFYALPGGVWWIEYEVIAEGEYEFIAAHNKLRLIATAEALEVALLAYPDPTQDSADVQSMLAFIANSGLAPAVKLRLTNLINNMYSAYLGIPVNLEAETMRNRLAELVALIERLV